MAFIAFGLSVYNTYVHVWPRHYATATVVGISAEPIEEQSANGLLHVRVDLALWNRGHLPAVISDGSLSFNACHEWLFAQEGTSQKSMPSFPFVIAPGKVVLETLEAAASPSLTLQAGRLNCAASVRANKRGTIYVDVSFRALQSDGRTASSLGLGGELLQGPTSGLDLKDKYGSVGNTTMSPYVWIATDRNLANPISVIPAAYTSRPTGFYW